MKRLIVIFLILSISGVNIKGQDNLEKSSRVLFITGITYDGNTLKSLPHTNFMVNSQGTYATDESGRFSFFGATGDTLVFTYMGYKPTKVIVPDTLRSKEYVMGVFMQEQAINLAEVIILSRLSPASIMISPVANDQKTLDIAQGNVDRAVLEGLTSSPKVFDADMNVKQTLRTNQLRTENKGMLVTPENSVGLSTIYYQTNNVFYGTPILIPNKFGREIVSVSEIETLLRTFKSRKRVLTLP